MIVMENFIETSFKRLREAKESNRLVVFVVLGFLQILDC